MHICDLTRMDLSLFFFIFSSFFFFFFVGTQFSRAYGKSRVPIHICHHGVIFSLPCVLGHQFSCKHDPPCETIYVYHNVGIDTPLKKLIFVYE